MQIQEISDAVLRPLRGLVNEDIDKALLVRINELIGLVPPLTSWLDSPDPQSSSSRDLKVVSKEWEALASKSRVKEFFNPSGSAQVVVNLSSRIKELLEQFVVCKPGALAA